jgi:flagellar hook-associated protein 2
MASITSPGIGSGLDINSLVSQLVDAEKKPQTDRLDTKEAELQARLSAFGTLKGALSSLQSSLSGLTSLSTYRGRTATSSDTDVLTATAGTTAAAGNYQISLTGLATGHKLATDPVNQPGARFDAVTDIMGTGTLTFKFGTTAYDKDTDTYTSFEQNAEQPSYTVEIKDGSLQGIRDAINGADMGITASIIFDGTYQRLALSADDTGAANSLEITVEDNDGNNTDASGLSLLAFNSAATNMTQTQAAQDTQGLSIDGIAVSSASNTLTDVINGLTVNLLEPGSSTLAVEYDKDSVSSAVSSFVDKYNGLISTINDLSSYDVDTGEAGLLNGDGVLRSVDAQVRRVFSQIVNGLNGPYRQLADIGITRNASDGSLVLDNTKLEAAIDDDFDAIAGMFTAYGSTTDSLIQYQSSTDVTQTGNYDINITRLASQGTFTGSQAAGLTITKDVNDGLTVSIDGVATTITLSAKTYDSATALAAELQSRLNANADLQKAGVTVKVGQSGGILTVTSDSYGSGSKVSVTGGNGRTTLFGLAPVSTDGVDVAGTIGGVAATGDGQRLTGNGIALGLQLMVVGGVTGNRGSVSFTRGYAEQLNNVLDQLLQEGGVFTSVTDGIDRSLDDIDTQREQVDSRSQAYEARIRAQFTAMDILVSQLKSTSDFLTQQLDSLSQMITNQSKQQ